MDHETFRKTLEQFAKLKGTKPPRSPHHRTTEEDLEIMREGVHLPMTKDYNPTLATEVVKFLPSVKDCEDCGRKAVENRQINCRVVTYPKLHWRQSCTGCGKIQDPYTGEYNLNGMKAQVVYIAYFKDKK